MPTAGADAGTAEKRETQARTAVGGRPGGKARIREMDEQQGIGLLAVKEEAPVGTMQLGEGRCPQCGGANPDGALYCTQCGAWQGLATADEPWEGTDRGPGVAKEHVPAASPESIDIEALKEIAGIGQSAGQAMAGDKPVKVRLGKKEKKKAKKGLKEARRQAKREIREIKASGGKKKGKATKSISIAKQLKLREKELGRRSKDRARHRQRAKDPVSYIGYDLMFESGLCEVEPGLYSETLEFTDISYQSASTDAQKGVFSQMCALNDSFGEDTVLQYSMINTPLSEEDVEGRKYFDPKAQATERQCEFAGIYNKVIRKVVAEGDHAALSRRRLLTYMTAAPDARRGQAKLARIRTEVSETLSRVRSATRVLSGAERLEVLNSQLRPGSDFAFDYKRDIRLAGGYTTKDAISPSSVDFGVGPTYFRTEGAYGQVLSIRRFGSDLNDRVIADISDLPIPLNLTWFVQGMDKSEAINMVRLRGAWIDKEMIEKQQKASNSNYNTSLIPSELRYSKEEMEAVLAKLRENERLFLYTGLVYTYAESKEKLDEQVMQIVSVARRSSVEITTLDYRQREGLNSVLPLGMSHVDISRYFTTGQVAIMMPFATQELADPRGLYLGRNKVSGNPVICDRKKALSPMGFVCGMTGSGKSFTIKNMIQTTILSTEKDKIYILDRSGEYVGVTQENAGEVVRFGVDSDTHLNPFDLSGLRDMSYTAQVSNKIDALVAQATAEAEEARMSLSQSEKSIISTAVQEAYAEAAGQRRDPLLEDFYKRLNAQPEEQAKELALRYRNVVRGPQSFFNHPTNVSFDNRVVDLSLRELPDSMVVFALITICEAVRNEMYKNHEAGIRTWFYVEEIESLFKYPTVLSYFSRFANEGRKFGLLMTGISQSAKALLENAAAAAIIRNSDFLFLLRQSPEDRMNWAELLDLSPLEESYIDETTTPGDGLVISGAAHVPTSGKFPSGNPLYDIYNTDADGWESEAWRKAAARPHAPVEAS